MNDFMRKVLLFAVLSAALLTVLVPTGCIHKKAEAQDSLQADSLAADTSAADSAESIISETPMPKAADELFDDFVFNFGRYAWKMERFFMLQEYYTLIFDNERQKNLVKDTTIDHVVIEKIFFRLKTVQQFLFNRVNGEWMLTSMNYKPMYQNQNASFLKFYQRFATDSAFQVRSMADEVQFTAPDPEDDFSTISGVMMPQQWPDFKPSLIPSGIIYNILYGQKYTESGKKIFLIRGIANGLEIEMTFKRMGGHWKLTKFNS